MTDLSHYYDLFLAGMTALAVVVFIALFFVRAGYGMLRDGTWGPKIDNRLGWIAMEASAPRAAAMRYVWSFSGCSSSTT